jgi:hypothetical protein
VTLLDGLILGLLGAHLVIDVAILATVVQLRRLRAADLAANHPDRPYEPDPIYQTLRAERLDREDGP